MICKRALNGGFAAAYCSDRRIFGERGEPCSAPCSQGLMARRNRRSVLAPVIDHRTELERVEYQHTSSPCSGCPYGVMRTMTL
jgi:hypothetical protein